jgi:hypothetical protein
MAAVEEGRITLLVVLTVHQVEAEALVAVAVEHLVQMVTRMVGVVVLAEVGAVLTRVQVTG